MTDITDKIEALPPLYDDPFVRVAYNPNPLDPSERIIGDVEWEVGKTLAEYLVGIPEDITWHVWHKTDFVPQEQWANVVPDRGDIIVILPEVQDEGGKSLFRLVAMLAIAVAAPYLAGPAVLGFTAGTVAYTAAVAGITIAGALLINFLIPPPKPKGPGNDTTAESPTYGYDGVKNTATEDVVVPLVYGEAMIGGNVIDFYAANADDTQYIYQRFALSEGEVEEVLAPRINDQPFSNFQDIEWHWRAGTETQEIDPWFADTLRPFNVTSALADDAWVSYSTTGPVDQLRLDVVFPQGLVKINDKNGNREEQSVEMLAELSSDNGASWSPLALSASGAGELAWAPVTGTRTPLTEALKLDVKVEPENPNVLYPASSYKLTVEYRKFGETSWTLIEESTGSFARALREVRTGDNSQWFEYLAPVEESFSVEDLERAEYEWRVTATGSVSADGPTVAAQSFSPKGSVTDPSLGTFTVTAARSNAVRRSFETNTLPEGNYMVRIKRASPESTDDLIRDQVFLSDVNEIVHEDIRHLHTATGAIKIRFTDQLQQVPTVAWPVKGRKVAWYDAAGNVEQVAWSDNPALITLDILLHERYGAGLAPSRIDFPKFYEWRLNCEARGYKFNGVFDYKTNIWDAVQVVCRVGHAQIVLAGTKYSLAIEKAELPVMMFGSGNIVKGSFSIEWLRKADRANEIEVVFYNKAKNYARDSVRVVDFESIARGDTQRVSSVEIIGINTVEQAWFEGHYLMASNKYTNAAISFDAPLEAIACTVGDVIAVSHDMPDWDVSGRLMPGSTATTLRLDRAVPQETNRVLVHFDAINRGTRTVTNKSAGGLITLSAAITQQIDRVRKGAFETGVAGRVSNNELILHDASSINVGDTLELWSTDSIEEVTASPDATGTELTVSLSAAPNAYANYMAGRTGVHTKLFRVGRIERDQELTRTIRAVEYNESVFADPANAAPNDLGGTFQRGVSNCRVYQIIERVVPQGDTNKSLITIQWYKPVRGQYGGARIHVMRDGGANQHIATVTSAETEFTFEALLGEALVMQVQAIDASDNTARPLSKVPRYFYTVLGRNNAIDFDGPTALAITDIVGGVTVQWVNPADQHDYGLTEIWRAGENDRDQATLLGTVKGTSFTTAELDIAQSHFFWVRNIATDGNPSMWSNTINDGVELNPLKPLPAYNLRAYPIAGGAEIVWDQPDDPRWSVSEVYIGRIDAGSVPSTDLTFEYVRRQGAAARIKGDHYTLMYRSASRSEASEEFLITASVELSDADFIERLYTLWLDRPSDAPGKSFWVNRLTTDSRPIVERDFIAGAVYGEVTAEQFITQLYLEFLDRQPDAPGLAFWVGRAQEPTWDWAILKNHFLVAATVELSDAEFVNELFLSYLQRSPSPEEQTYWADVMSTKGDTFRFWVRPLDPWGRAGDPSDPYDLVVGKIGAGDLDDDVQDGAYLNTPATPSNLTVAPITDGLRVSWSYGANPMPRETEVYYASTNSRPATPQRKVAGTSVDLSGLDGSDTYYVWVRAVNSAERVSPYVGPTVFAAQPSGIINFGYQRVTNGIELTWEDPYDPKWVKTEVYIERRDNLINQQPSLADARSRPPVAVVSGTKYLRTFRKWRRAETIEAFVKNTTPAELSDTQFVEVLYNKYMGRASDPAGLSYYSGLLSSNTRIEVERQFLEGATVELTDQEYLTELFLRFLNRAPDAPGLAYWLGQLARSDRDRIQIRNAFLDASVSEISNIVFISRLFSFYFNRAATSQELSDWVNDMDTSGGEFRAWVRPVSTTGSFGPFSNALDVEVDPVSYTDLSPLMAADLHLTTPADPTSFTATGIPGDGVMLNCTLPSPLPKYIEVYWSTTSTRPSTPGSILSAATSLSVRNLTPGQSYNFWIRALNSPTNHGNYIGPVSASPLAGGSLTTYFEATAPASANAGDLWFDTDDNNKLYRYSGSAWLEAADSRVSEAIQAAADAQATADGKIKTFFQTSAPSGASVGDLWVDTNDSNKLYRYSGSSWAQVTGRVANLNMVGRYDIESIDFNNVNVYGTLSGNIINGGQITGSTIRTASGTTRIQLNASDNSFEAYESGTLRFSVDMASASPYLYVNAASSATAAYIKNTNGPALYLYGDLEFLGGGSVSGSDVNGEVAKANDSDYLGGNSASNFLQLGYKSTSSSSTALWIRNTSSGTEAHGFRAQSTYGSPDRSGIVGGRYDDFNAEGDGTYGYFTGAHYGLVLKTGDQPQPGDVVIDVGLISQTGISHTVCEVALTNIAGHKAVAGVVVDAPQPLKELHNGTGQMVFGNLPRGLWTHRDAETGERVPVPEAEQIAQDYYWVKINALGEGQVNVCNEGGDIEVGDLLETSSIPGKVRRQADNVFRASTLGKARQNLTFSGPTDFKMIACSYHSA